MLLISAEPFPPVADAVIHGKLKPTVRAGSRRFALRFLLQLYIPTRNGLSIVLWGSMTPKNNAPPWSSTGFTTLI